MPNLPAIHKKIDFLVVDDQDYMLQSIRNLLRELYSDKQIVIARSGKEALTILKENQTNFLITDWNMPNMTGIELIKIVRNNPNLYTIPAMMVSDEIDKEKFLYAIEEGVDGYQIKPFTQEKLITSVNSIIRARKEWTPFHLNMSRLRRLFLIKKYDDVITLANKISKNKDNPDILLILSESYYAKKDYGNARNVLKNLIHEEKNGKAMHLFGRILMDDGDVKKALLYLKKALAINQINCARKIDVGRAYLDLERLEEAATLFDSIKHDSPTDISMLGAGKAYLDKGNIDQAGCFIEHTSDPIPETVAIYNDYAIQLSKVGNFTKSLSYYKKCLNVHPNNEVLLFNIAVVYFKIKDIKKARLCIDKLLKIYPGNTKASALLKRIGENS